MAILVLADHEQGLHVARDFAENLSRTLYREADQRLAGITTLGGDLCFVRQPVRRSRKRKRRRIPAGRKTAKEGSSKEVGKRIRLPYTTGSIILETIAENLKVADGYCINITPSFQQFGSRIFAIFLPLPLPSANGMFLPGDAARLDLDNHPGKTGKSMSTRSIMALLIRCRHTLAVIFRRKSQSLKQKFTVLE